jgi:hypothetical protein
MSARPSSATCADIPGPSPLPRAHSPSVIFPVSQVIPRWLSVWGLAGTVLGLAAGLLVLFQSIGVLSGPQVVLNLPIAVQEMVLAVWLIVKGFSPKAKPKAPAPRAAELRPA